MVPAIGLSVVACMGVIALTDAHARAALPALAVTCLVLCGGLGLILPFALWSRGRSTALLATLLEDLAALTGGTRPALTPLDAPRVWCTVSGQRFEVIQKLVGRKAQLLYVEEEDGFRDLYRRLASAPQARVPRGRHWRVGIRGDAPAAYSLAVAAKGPLSMVGLKLSGLERVESGDAHFDDWAVVYTDRPASVARLLAVPDRRTTLLRMLTRNGSYVSWVQVRPPRGPSDPCVGMGFALHAQQTAHDLVDNLHDLVTLAGWTHEPS